MKEKAKILAMFIVAFVMVSTATGEIITVDDDGPADFNNIKAAIDYSKEGDTIIVAEGKYAKNINFLGKNITLTSINPTSRNIVDGTIIDGRVTFRGTEGPSCTLTGFNIDSRIIGFDRLIDPNGENHTHATISYCILENILYTGSVIAACDGTISNCLIANIYPGILVPWRVPSIIGCHGLIKNCTIVDIPDGIEVMEGGTCTIENSILYHRALVFVSSGATLNISYCDLESGLNRILGSGTVNWGPGNIDMDPFFARLGGLQDKGNYHLLQNSPCIDASDPGYVPMPNETDLDGNPRIIGDAVDMGAYEFQGVHTLYVNADAPAGGEGGSWATAFRHLQDALFNAMPPAEIRVAHGIYKPHLNTYSTAPPSRTDTFQLKNGVTMKGGYAGLGQADPNARGISLYKTILSGDINGDDIEVTEPHDLLTEPTRAENSYHVLTGSVTSASAVLDGFTITAGNANGLWPDDLGAGILNRYSRSSLTTNCTFNYNSAKQGGGFFGTGILTNCTFIDNYAEDEGGGMVNYYSVLINCRFSNNSAGNRGGGMVNIEDAQATLINCIFSSNTAASGGAICNYSFDKYGGLELINCTLSDNSASEHGGGIFNDSTTPELTNSILWANSDISGQTLSAQIYNYGSGGTIVKYSCIQGWAVYPDYTDNIDADPCFVDSPNGDYHLLAGSLCIDAGDPNHVAEPNETDLDGRPRIFGGRIDMGAYEYRPSIPAEARIIPRTINLASKGNWLTCYIWLPESYNVADIDPNSVFLEDEIQPDLLSLDEQKQVAIAKFNREELRGIINTGEVELTITGRLTDGTIFEATDVIRIVDRNIRKI